MPRFAGEPSSWKHHLVETSPGVSLHYVDVPPSTSASQTTQTIILIHGFPQTWYEFRHIMQPLADAGFRVIAVDYRGAGASSRPSGGYDKFTMAKDIRTLHVDKLGMRKPVVLGHDIGSMIAVDLALQFPENVEKLVASEAPHPGTSAYDLVTRDDRFMYDVLWHWFFHAHQDLPELLTAGKEREYIADFFKRMCYDPSFLTREDLDKYTDSYSHAGGLRAAFDVYRAFRKDREDYLEHMKTHAKLKMPVLAVAAEHSFICELAEDMCKEFAEDVKFVKISRANHYFPEENPDDFVKAILEWVA